VHFNGQRYQNLPDDLAEQLRNLPALPPILGRGHGRGRGRGQPPPPVSAFFFGSSAFGTKMIIRYNTTIFREIWRDN
jgi:hypothetical protein